MRGLTGFTVAVVLAVAAACGGGDESTSADGETPSETTRGAVNEDTATGESPMRSGGEICKLLTDAEVEQLLGGPFIDQRGADIEEGGNCSYTGADVMKSVNVSVFRGPGAADAFDGERDLAGGDATPISGLGDRAFITSLEISDNTSLQVLVGDTHFQLGAPADAATTETVGRAAVNRL